MTIETILLKPTMKRRCSTNPWTKRMHQHLIASGTSRSKCKFQTNFSSKVSKMEGCAEHYKAAARSRMTGNSELREGKPHLGVVTGRAGAAAHVALQRAGYVVIIAEVKPDWPVSSAGR
jgi:hypothetical protein